MSFKTFDDLEFKKHPAGNGFQGLAEFPNGYGVSVVRFKLSRPFGPQIGYGSYTSDEDEWELAILKDGSITYNTPITEDVIGHLTKDQVTEIMKQVQELKK